MGLSRRRLAVAGAGLSGAVLARELAEAGHEVDVFEPRAHVAGNCHTERDPETGVLVHRHGPHIFHTDDAEVRAFVCRFGEFRPFRHRVRAVVRGRTYGLPVNLGTLRDFFGREFGPDEARAFLAAQAEGGPDDPANFEQQGLRTVGRALYEAFFEGYTRKQWGVDPRRLPAAVFRRLPVRFDHDDSYFNHAWQAMPAGGYTAVIQAMLDAPGVTLRLGQVFRREETPAYGHVFFTGPLDAYFGHEHGRLAYRTLDFRDTRHDGVQQECPVVNYCDAAVPWTRITEHRHFAPWETPVRTVCTEERSRAAGPDDTPYYPVRFAADEPVLAAYVGRARQEKGVTFVGRLGTYRYLDMDRCVAEARRCAREFLAARARGEEPPVFSADPLAHG